MNIKSRLKPLSQTDILILSILAAVVLLNLYSISPFQKEISTIPTNNFIPGEKALREFPFPPTGALKGNIGKGKCPLKIIPPADNRNNYLVKVVGIDSGKEGIYTIRARDKLNVKIPEGMYKVQFASGRKWYGFEDNKLFGIYGQYSQSNKILTFTFDGTRYRGHTITLQKQTNGNLPTSPVSRENF